MGQRLADHEIAGEEPRQGDFKHSFILRSMLARTSVLIQARRVSYTSRQAQTVVMRTMEAYIVILLHEDGGIGTDFSIALNIGARPSWNVVSPNVKHISKCFELSS